MTLGDDATVRGVQREFEAPAGSAQSKPRLRTRIDAGIRSLLRSADVLRALTEADLRFRYGRGPGRFLRWLLEPFALVGIYLLFVTFVLDRSGPAPGLSLACAIVPFQLVMATVANAMEAVDIRKPILLNMRFERKLIPLSSTLTETTAFSASFLIVVVMMAAYHVAPTLALLWLPLVVIVNLYLAAAAAYAATLLGLWLHELKPFLLSFVRMLFFLGPGIVPLAAASANSQEILRFNPLTGMFEAYRDVFLNGVAPAPWELLYPFAIATAILFVFVPLYGSEQRQFAKVV
jgi:ABC-type polysaccharide/polyol phosphate export systems, permease component